MTCTISGCKSDADVKMFHYSFDEEIQDFVRIGTIIVCDKHAKEIIKKTDQKITV